MGGTIPALIQVLHVLRQMKIDASKYRYLYRQTVQFATKLLGDHRTMTSSPFYFESGKLFCEQANIEDLCNSIAAKTRNVSINGNSIEIDVPSTPAFIYSSAALKRNVFNYKDAMRQANIKGRLGYAVKANGNQGVLQALKENGVDILVTVSGNEILAGMKAGFKPQNIILNGNGKQDWEVKLAIHHGVILNVDSIFDASRMTDIHKKFFPEKEVKVLLRLRPNENVHGDDSSVHPYVNTAEDSKFGFDMTDLDEVLGILEQQRKIQIHGIHCHYGSCIYDPGVYRYMGELMAEMTAELKKRGYAIEVLDIGGGIGINYHENFPGIEGFLAKDEEVSPFESVKTSQNSKNSKNNQHTPDIGPFMQAISGIIPSEITIIVEPGRSLVANTGILISKVLGSKTAGEKRYMVIDGSMAEIIRPCLYGSHHQIYPTTLKKGIPWLTYDVVGPICETADFLGNNVLLQECAEYLAIMDAGAYCSSMSSNYNMRPRPAEILVSGSSWRYIRQRDTFEEMIVNT